MNLFCVSSTVFAFLTSFAQCNPEEPPPIFELHFSAESANAWIKANSGDSFSRSPAKLAKDKNYRDSVVAIHTIAVRGDFLNGREVVSDILSGVRRNDFSPLIGWCESLQGTTGARHVLRILPKVLEESNSVGVKTLAAYWTLILLAEGEKHGNLHVGIKRHVRSKILLYDQQIPGFELYDGDLRAAILEKCRTKPG